MKSLLLSFAILVGLISTAPAHANITYQWITTSVTDGGPFRIDTSFTRSFTITDEAFEVGSMSFFTGYCPPCAYPNGFVGTDLPPDIGNPSPLGLGSMTMNVIFNADGSLSGAVRAGGIIEDLSTSGTGFEWTGLYSSDSSFCYSPRCTVTGYWAQVPEPEMNTAFAAVLLGLFALRRKQMRTGDQRLRT